jgi:murein hydrolase activator
MTIKNSLQSGLFLFIVVFNLQFVIAQKSSRLGLEEKKIQIQKELKAINEMLFDNKKRKAIVFSDIENLNYKIQRKEELVRTRSSSKRSKRGLRKNDFKILSNKIRKEQNNVFAVFRNFFSSI